MSNVSRLLLSLAILGGAAVPAFAQGTAMAAPHHHASRMHRATTSHDVGAAAKSTPSSATTSMVPKPN